MALLSMHVSASEIAHAQGKSKVAYRRKDQRRIVPAALISSLKYLLHSS